MGAGMYSGHTVRRPAGWLRLPLLGAAELFSIETTPVPIRNNDRQPRQGLAFRVGSPCLFTAGLGPVRIFAVSHMAAADADQPRAQPKRVEAVAIRLEPFEAGVPDGRVGQPRRRREQAMNRAANTGRDQESRHGDGLTGRRKTESLGPAEAFAAGPASGGGPGGH